MSVYGGTFMDSEGGDVRRVMMGHEGIPQDNAAHHHGPRIATEHCRRTALIGMLQVLHLKARNRRVSRAKRAASPPESAKFCRLVPRA
jgi:hypothetical protein